MVNILPSAEQQMVVDSVAEMLARECPVDRLRNPRLAVREQELLQRFGEMGWFSFGAAEGQAGDLQGAGFGLAEEMLMFREFGRFLLSPALLAQGLGARLAALAGEAQLAERLAAGGEAVALAHASRPLSGGAAKLDGELLLVDVGDAEWLLIVNEGGAALLRKADLANVQTHTAMDDALLLQRAEAHAAPLLMRAEGPGHWLRHRLLIAAQLVGAAEASRDMASAYAKLRTQFGKPIGSFQAIAHHCADMAVRAEAAWCQTLFAAIALRDGRQDAAFQVAAACHVAGDAAFQNATLNIRVHGGIGFTADCHAQRYLKRAVLLRQLAGGTLRHDAALLDTSYSL